MLPPPAVRPALTREVTKAFGQGGEGLDDVDPEADVEKLLEDGDELFAAAERPPKAEERELDDGEHGEESVDGGAEVGVAATEDGDEVLKRAGERVEVGHHRRAAQGRLLGTLTAAPREV